MAGAFIADKESEGHIFLDLILEIFTEETVGRTPENQRGNGIIHIGVIGIKIGEGGTAGNADPVRAGKSLRFFHFIFQEFFVYGVGVGVPGFHEFIIGMTVGAERSTVFIIIGAESIGIDGRSGFPDHMAAFFGIEQFKGLRGHAAQGMTDDIGFFNAFGIHKSGNIGGVIRSGIETGFGLIGFTVAAKVDHINMIAGFGKIRSDQRPAAAVVRHAVDQHEGFTVFHTHFHIGHGDAGGKIDLLAVAVPISLGNFHGKFRSGRLFFGTFTTTGRKNKNRHERQQ